jgi:hypothetical protein
MNVGYRRFSSPVIVALLLAAPASLWAGHPPGPVDFGWGGNGLPNNVGDGNGNLGDWSLWVRVPGDPDNPNDYFQPQDGDSLFIDATLSGGQDARRTITINSLAMGVNVGFEINAGLSGGNLSVASIGIDNTPWASAFNPSQRVYYTTDFSGTTLAANQFDIGSVARPISFTNSTIRADSLRMFGGAQLDASDPPTGVGQTNVTGSSLIFNTLEVGKSGFYHGGPYILNIDSSTVTGLGMDVSGRFDSGLNQGITARVQLVNGSNATLDQYVVVGTDDRGELIVSGNSKLSVNNGYLNVGDEGPGHMQVSQSPRTCTVDPSPKSKWPIPKPFSSNPG